MRVTVKLFAHLRKYLPLGCDGTGTPVELPDGATVADLIAALHIPPEYTGMVVSNDAHLERVSVLADGQEVDVFPPLAGGT